MKRETRQTDSGAGTVRARLASFSILAACGILYLVYFCRNWDGVCKSCRQLLAAFF